MSFHVTLKSFNTDSTEYETFSGTKFALFGHSYRRLPLQVVLWNVFQEFVNPDLLSIHRWSYGIVLYEVFTIGRLFVIFSYNAVNYSITLIEAMDGCFVFCQ